MSTTRELLAVVADAALCAQVDTELFFPVKGGTVIDAKRICARCPVVPECLQAAVDLDADGVWGGTSPRQRRGMAKSPDAVPPPVGGPPALDEDRLVALTAAGLQTSEIADVAGVTTRTVQRLRRQSGQAA